MWPTKWGAGKILFFLARYPTLIEMVFYMYCAYYFGPAPLTSQSFLDSLVRVRWLVSCELRIMHQLDFVIVISPRPVIFSSSTSSVRSCPVRLG